MLLQNRTCFCQYSTKKVKKKNLSAKWVFMNTLRGYCKVFMGNKYNLSFTCAYFTSVKPNKSKMNRATLYDPVLFYNIFFLTFVKDVILLVKLSTLLCFV